MSVFEEAEFGTTAHSAIRRFFAATAAFAQSSDAFQTYLPVDEMTAEADLQFEGHHLSKPWAKMPAAREICRTVECRESPEDFQTVVMFGVRWICKNLRLMIKRRNSRSIWPQSSLWNDLSSFTLKH
uniref:Acyl-CoA dehydrogenase n=1 Tax=Ascaris lumbricoides TaxID=6252 RepID=A0A0M3I5J2_ASCLU